ncbi:hypothetical protein D1007_51531 [Hordeum vulgare]|nr:hypothetical protein D1007_51531 [Hordeum vulgare]
MQSRHVADIVACLPTDSSKTEEDEGKEEQQQQEEEQLEAMEEDDPEEKAPDLSMMEAEAEFVITQSKKMAEQQGILDSIRDEAEVEANRRLIRQRQAEANAIFDELEAEIEADEAAVEQPEAPEGAKLRQAAIHSSEGMTIVDISDEE